jgi:hypothetical protein
MTDSHTSVVRCEDCGAERETTGGWSKPSGTAGAATTFTQAVQAAPVVLGRPGHLCTKCWWGRVTKEAA